MSEELEGKVIQSVETLDFWTALSVLHYASRLVKHRVSVLESSEPDKLWVAGISGEPSKNERVLGKEVVRLIEKQLQQTVDSWSEETASQVIAVLVKSAARLTHKSWGERELRQAKDYRDFCSRMPTVSDPELEFISLLDIESTRSKVEAIVSALPPMERRIFQMRLTEERSWEECAEALGISVTAARQLWYRTLRRMRNQLVHEG